MFKPVLLFATIFIIASCQVVTSEALPEKVGIKTYTEYCLKGANKYVEISNLAGVENQPLLSKIQTAVDKAYFEEAKPNNINAHLTQICEGKIAGKRIKEAIVYHNKNGLLSMQTAIQTEIPSEDWATYDLHTGELIALNPQIKPEKLVSLHNFILRDIRNIEELQTIEPNFKPQLSGRFHLMNERDLVVEWIVNQSQLQANFCAGKNCAGTVTIPQVVLKDFIIENSPLQRFIE